MVELKIGYPLRIQPSIPYQNMVGLPVPHTTSHHHQASIFASMCIAYLFVTKAKLWMPSHLFSQSRPDSNVLEWTNPEWLINLYHWFAFFFLYIQIRNIWSTRRKTNSTIDIHNFFSSLSSHHIFSHYGWLKPLMSDGFVDYVTI